MNAEKLLYAIGNVREEFVREADPARPVKRKNYRPLLATLGTLAACFALIWLIRLPNWGSFDAATEDTKTEDATTESATEDTAAGSDGTGGGNETMGPVPSITIDGVTYLTSSHSHISKACPEGFSHAGEVMIDGIDQAYYTNPEIPEWIYVYQECYNNIKQEPYWAYVRWVDASIRGIKFIRYNDQIYCALIDTYYFTEDEVSAEARERYDRADTQYSWRIEAETVEGFTEVGSTVFEEHDRIPQENFGSNIITNEIWANPDDSEILLVRDYWFTAPATEEIRHTGFMVYVLYEP